MPDLPQITFDFSAEHATPKEPLSGKPILAPAEKPKGIRGRKSLKELGHEVDNVRVPEDEILFKNNTIQSGKWQKCLVSTIRYCVTGKGVRHGSAQERKGRPFFFVRRR
jgi:hypothetical protein